MFASYDLKTHHWILTALTKKKDHKVEEEEDQGTKMTTVLKQSCLNVHNSITDNPVTPSVTKLSAKKVQIVLVRQAGVQNKMLLSNLNLLPTRAFPKYNSRRRLFDQTKTTSAELRVISGLWLNANERRRLERFRSRRRRIEKCKRG